MKAGLLLTAAGVWLVCQVTKGQALARLKLIPSPCEKS